MDAEGWVRLKGIFHAALEVPLAERTAFLENACGGNHELEAQVRALLQAHEGAGDFLNRQLLDLDPELALGLEDAVAGLRLGPYRVLSELGRGGMGAVFLAVRDDDTYRQQVAIKLIKRGMDSEEIVRRFVAERQILARLIHPNIARLSDGGTTADGRPYFVMEAIAGRPITDFCRERGLGVEARLRLFLAVAGAVHFAHQNLVVHRDLKPANVLVGEDGVPKLLDFGIAKLVDEAAAGEGLTAAGSRPRTPDYASPEQLEDGPVTTATDVYGLGLLLFELLAGGNPRTVSRGLSRDGEVRPLPDVALRLGSVGGAPTRDANRLARRLTGDLELIVAKALAREPERRYGSVRDFAEDIERHLEHRPIKARRPTPAYRVTRFLRRYRLASAAAFTVLLLAVAATYQAVEAARQRDRAEGESRRARALSDFLIDLFEVADPSQNRGATITARELLDAGANRLEPGAAAPPRWLRRSGEALAAEPASRADMLHTVGEVYQSLGMNEEAESALRRAEELRRSQRGAAAELDLARTLVQRAHLSRTRGDHEASEALYREALALRQRLAGEDHLDTAEVWNGLGLLASAKGDAASAKESLERAIELQRKAGEAGRLPLAETLSNLAGVEITLGDATLAVAVLDEARRLHRELLGDDHPRTASDLSNLGGLLFTRGDYAGARARFEEAVALRRRLLGDQHPHLAVALSNLATVELEEGALAAAEAHLREALAIQRRDKSGPHADVAHALNNLASVVRERGEPAAAAALFEEALAMYRQVFGPRHGMVATCLNNLALALRDQGQLSSAERLAGEALALRREVFGAEHAQVAASLFTLADLAERGGRFEEAERLGREALAQRQRLLAADHPAVASSLVGLGGLLLRQGRLEEAEPLLRQGLDLRHKSLPARHALVAVAESLLGEALARRGETGEAQHLLIRAHRTLLAVRGPDHPESAAAALRLRKYTP